MSLADGQAWEKENSLWIDKMEREKDEKMNSIKDMVKDNKKVKFQRYKDLNLWYVTECGFEFPVPISDTGTATFLEEDKALLFMRYIRKHLNVIAEGK